MKLDEQIIEEIKNRTNIVDVISKYIPVSKKGRFSILSLLQVTNPLRRRDKAASSSLLFSCFFSGKRKSVII